MGLFKIINKVIEVLYRLDLLLKIKIYLVYYITMLELVYRNFYKLIKLVLKCIKIVVLTAYYLIVRLN